MFLLIDKAKGVTSHDVVYAVRKITGEKRVGHGGTLDPNATGLVVIGVTRAGTKELGKITKETTKEYVAELYLGEERTTDDPEGEIISKSDIKTLDEEVIKNVVKQFIGEQQQIPPIFSAIKMNGKKAYELARKGQDVEMKPRTITVYEAEILKYEYPLLEIRFKVSSGTYIRSLARDIGRKLGTYAYLSNLRRTKIGNIDISRAVKIDDLDSMNWKEYIMEELHL